MALPKNKKLSRRPAHPNGSAPAPQGVLSHAGGKKGGKGKNVTSKNVKGGKNRNEASKLGNGMPAFYGGRGGYKGVSTKKVRGLTNGLIKDEVRSIKREKGEVKRDSVLEARSARRDYRRGKQDLRHVYGETGDYLKHLAEQNQGTFTQQSGLMDAANAALQQQLGGTYTGAIEGVNSEMARLGIEGGANTGQMFADQAFSQAQGAQAGANAQSTLGLTNANANQLSGLVQGMNQGSFMSAMGQNLNRRNDTLGEIKQNRIDNMDEITGAIRDVRMGRKDLFTQLLNQLQETGWGQYMDQQHLNLARKQANRQ